MPTHFRSLSPWLLLLTFPLVAQEVPPGAEPINPVRELQRSYAAVSSAVWPSVVTVRAYERVDPTAPAAKRGAGWVEALEPTYEGFREFSAVTGWVVREDGEILTCNHRLLKPDGSPPDLIDFETNDYQRVIAERVGVEPTVNLAILQAVVWPNSHPRKLPALRFGDSTALLPGHQLFAFGDPSGPLRWQQLGTFIAQPARDCYQDLLSSFYMQVGMVAHPQAYGGPLVDMGGNVVGILAPPQVKPGDWAASQRLGVEFGLPTKIIENLYQAIRQARSFRSPWLGFAVMSRPEFAKARGIDAYQQLEKPRNGILIENVFEPSPASKAGLQPGDWLVTFDKQRIFTPVDFQKQLYLAGIGTKVRLEVFRAGKSDWHELVIEERPPEAKPR